MCLYINSRFQVIWLQITMVSNRNTHDNPSPQNTVVPSTEILREPIATNFAFPYCWCNSFVLLNLLCNSIIMILKRLKSTTFVIMRKVVDLTLTHSILIPGFFQYIFLDKDSGVFILRILLEFML